MAERASSGASETIAQVPSGDYAVPALAGVHGTIRFESAGGHVHMQIHDGAMTLSRLAEKADLVLRSHIPGELLRVVRGEANAVTAVLRGLVEAEGDLMLLMKVAGALPEIGRPAPGPTTPERGAPWPTR